ncbi:hypothetical protein PoB_003559600 [Plakobranchus ocellatus]|uniref:Uncharacterized protein n=1 Tax=Plakobranchus ocellatus TaxID=259542 RepID=A0AAV4ARA5_9GAST|nr:hypothetical protein PoB_003559600 [Plakobranchus ocellatus]
MDGERPRERDRGRKAKGEGKKRVRVEMVVVFYVWPVHNKVISDFQALSQARALVAESEPATEGSLQISRRARYPLCHRCPEDGDYNKTETLRHGRKRE